MPWVSPTEHQETMLKGVRQDDAIAVLRGAADEALNVLIGCCIPAGGVDDRAAIIRVQAMLRSALKQTAI